MTTLRVIVVAMTCLLSAACAEPHNRDFGEVNAEFAVSEVDSAGVTIITTAADIAQERLDWVIGSTPELQLGELSGALPYQFHDVAGVTTLSDERIVVLDGGSRELRLFDASGSFQYAIGRRGEGPGEFRVAMLMSSFGSDTLSVYDPLGRRVTRFEASGELVSVSPPHQSAIHTPSAAVSVGNRGIIMSKGLLLISSGSGIVTRPRMARFTGIDANSGVLNAWPEMRGVLEFTDHRLDIRGIDIVPFDIWPDLAPSPNGVVISNGETAEIQEVDASGRLRRVMRVSGLSRAVEEEDLHRLADERSRDSPEWRSWRIELYRQLPVPSTMPAFQDILVDNSGWAWAELYVPSFERNPTESEWMVFDRRGRACGTMVLPRSLDIERIGWAYVLGVNEDELGVERIQKYTLARRGEQSRDRCAG